MKKSICYILICVLLTIGFLGLGPMEMESNAAPNHYSPDDLIRFHVIANSDSEHDQLLKYAVRDEILKEVSPRLARSGSLLESRIILEGMYDELLDIARRVIQEWGYDYAVALEYGVFAFPTKSYGDIVLAGGDYEAVEIKIGQAQGANWWCVLFPPLCFVNADEATNIPVDGEEAVPLDTAAKKLERRLDQKFERKNPQQFCFFFERFFN
jgi:stage II sporulation protein R